MGGGPPYDYVALLDAEIAAIEEAEQRQARLPKAGAARGPLRRRPRPLSRDATRGRSPPISIRLSGWFDTVLREEFGRIGVTLSEGVRQVLEEWWVLQRFRMLEFRDPEFLRTAAIRSGPAVRDWFVEWEAERLRAQRALKPWMHPTQPEVGARDPLRSLPAGTTKAEVEELIEYCALFRDRLEQELEDIAESDGSSGGRYSSEGR